MNYNLNKASEKAAKKLPVFASLKKLVAIISGERRQITLAFSAIFLNAGLSLMGPYLVGYTIDHYVQAKDYHGVLLFSGILLLSAPVQTPEYQSSDLGSPHRNQYR